MAWNTDETLFYLSHSEERTVYQHSYDLQNGVLNKKSVSIHLAGASGIPDGAAMDAEEGSWCATHGAGCLPRYTRDGQLNEIVRLPVSQPIDVLLCGGYAEWSLYNKCARKAFC